jgi:hypothetical protein
VRLGIDLTGEVDLERAIDRDEAAEIVDRQAATGYPAANIRNIGRHDVVGATGEKPPPGAERQREKHAEWRAALRLGIKQAGEEHRFRCRLSPPDCLAGTDQLRKIERFGRYGDRCFHAAQGRHLRRGRNSRRVIRLLIRSAENSASCRKRICPPTSRIIHLPFASRSGHHTPICASSCPRVGPSLPPILEKLTDSAIIKVALREDLSEVATGSRWLGLR